MDKLCYSLSAFDVNIREYFRKLRKKQKLFDVTLATKDGQHIQAHKIILSSGSDFFSEIFMKSDHSKMLVYLKGISNKGLQQVLDFLYNGEVSIDQENMNDFLETCKELEVKGLYDKFTKTDTQSTEKREMNEHGKNKEKNIGNSEDAICTENIYHLNEDLCTENISDLKDNMSTENIDNSKNNIVTKNINNLITDLYSENIVNLKDDLCTMKIKEGARKEMIQLKTDNNELDFQLDELTLKVQEGVWQCKVCGKTDSKRARIRTHAEIHIEGISHACHICDKTFSTSKNLSSHISKIHTGTFICNTCEIAGMTRSAYNKHKRKYHKK